MDFIIFTALFMILAIFLVSLKSNTVHDLFNYKGNPNLPPVVKTWPLVGSLYMLLNDPENLIRKSYHIYGSVFTIRVLGLNIIMLIGPEVSKYFYTAPDSELSQSELYKSTTPMFGPNVFFDPNVSAETRRQQFNFLKTALRPQMLRYYVGKILMEAQDYFSKWQDFGTVDLVEELQHLISLVATRYLLGKDVKGKLPENILSLNRELANGVLPISYFFPYLPIPAHNRRDKARRNLNQIFSNIINARKNSTQSEEDLLQTLLNSRYADGKRNTDEQVSGLSIGFLFVGQHTTGFEVVDVGAHLLQNKTYFSKVIEEQKMLLRRHGSKLDFDILGEMEVLHRCIKEAIRIGPFSVMLPRYCRKAFTVTTKEGKEYVIPKGHIVATSPATVNRIDNLFKDPYRYDPDRYLFDGKGEITSQPFSDISFGGGRHRCPGETFTYITLKTIWSYLIRNFEIDLVSSFPEGKWNGKDKILVQYKRRQLSI